MNFTYFRYIHQHPYFLQIVLDPTYKLNLIMKAHLSCVGKRGFRWLSLPVGCGFGTNFVFG